MENNIFKRHNLINSLFKKYDYHRKPIDFLFYLLSDSKCANVYLFISAKLVSKLAMLVGSFTVSSTESSLMVKCRPIKP